MAEPIKHREGLAQQGQLYASLGQPGNAKASTAMTQGASA
jgi:hypothetical protein